MKTKPGWLIVILISSVQLALLLVAALMLFSWFSSKTEEVVQKQVCDDNRVIAQYILNRAKSERVRDVGTPGTQDYHRLSKIAQKVQMPNHGFVCIVDGRSGSTVCPRRGETNFTDVKMAEVMFHKIGSSPTDSINDPRWGTLTLINTDTLSARTTCRS